MTATTLIVILILVAFILAGLLTLALFALGECDRRYAKCHAAHKATARELEKVAAERDQYRRWADQVRVRLAYSNVAGRVDMEVARLHADIAAFERGERP